MPKSFRRARLLVVLGIAAALAVVITTTAGGARRSALKDPPKITVGFLQILGSDQSAQRIQKNFQDAAKMLGWTVKVVDAQGDPAKMAAGVQSFVTQKVDAILTIAVAAGQASQGLTAAKKKGIPTIAVGSPNPDPNHLYDTQMAVSDSALGGFLGQYIVDQEGPGVEVVAQTYPSIDALARRNATAFAIFKKNNVKVVATHQVDFKNGVSDTIKSTLAMLRAHPKAKVVYVDQDFEFGPALQAVKQAGRSGKVKVYSYLSGADELAALRKGGDAAAIADSPEELASWVAADQFLNYFGLKKKIDPLAQYNVVQFPIAMITPLNVPAGSTYPWPNPKPIFTKRWKAAGFNVK